MLKKLATVLCLVVLCLGLATVAEGATSSGKCGDNLTWMLSSDGVLTISGTGAMYNYYIDATGSPAPWCDSRESIKSINIGNNVTSIGNYAFYSCCCDSDPNNPNRELVSVTIPDSVKSIGEGAFHSCDLASITIPDGVTSIGDVAFYWCTALKSITIPDSVTSIGSFAFFSCENLKHISIPEGVTTIDSGAFYGCTGLESITIPKALKTIKENAFNGCTSLAHVYYTGSKSQFEEITVVETGNDKFTGASLTCEYIDIYPKVQTILNHLLENMALTATTVSKVNVNNDANVDVGDIQKIYYDSVSCK